MKPKMVSVKIIVKLNQEKSDPVIPISRRALEIALILSLLLNIVFMIIGKLIENGFLISRLI